MPRRTVIFPSAVRSARAKVSSRAEKSCSREQKEALKKFSESLGEKNYEEHKGFFNKFKL